MKKNKQKADVGSVSSDAAVVRCHFCNKDMGETAEACENTGNEIVPGINESFPVCLDCGKQRHAQGREVVFIF